MRAHLLQPSGSNYLRSPHLPLGVSDGQYCARTTALCRPAVPLACRPGNSESCGFIKDTLNPMNGDYLAIPDNLFVIVDKVAALEEDANCFLESFIVWSIARIKLAYLPFCGVGNQNVQIDAAVMGYYFGTTGGGKYCGGQSRDFILEELIWTYSRCNYSSGTIDWYTKPCSVCSTN